MATKTISIDIEAYKRLKGAKLKSESFSQTIKRVIQQPIDFRQWMLSMESDPLSDEAVAAVEAVVSQRRHPRNRLPRAGGARKKPL
jgi:predicted CopG family antitoxin